MNIFGSWQAGYLTIADDFGIVYSVDVGTNPICIKAKSISWSWIGQSGIAYSGPLRVLAVPAAGVFTLTLSDVSPALTRRGYRPPAEELVPVPMVTWGDQKSKVAIPR